MRVDEIIHNLRHHDIVVPEFQREYVWSRAKAKELISSLLRQYPVGGLLLWKTTDPPTLKNLKDLPEHFGSLQILLDGQQRCTTLFMLCTGEVPPYYKESEIENDPRNLAFNLFTGELSYWQNSLMEGDQYWQLVVNCMADNNVNPIEIAKTKLNLLKALEESAQAPPRSILL